MGSTEDNQPEELSQNEENTTIDIDNRDPTTIHSYVVKMAFEDVIAEPSGVHSLGNVWKASYKTYSGSKMCCYGTLTTLFGVPLSLLWGLLFGCVSFVHIWTIMPCLKSCELHCQCLKQLTLMCGRTFPMMQGFLKVIISLRTAWYKTE
ncbi:caveolin-3-like [Thalassophryne amazonica]|uniref:caveolin-3-like n=1 Tax=Thalassophryne amazonica TaxID=390379 RepID=UPI00147115AF|nr:caveolin-3-like [Thalassophryne amazonica]